MPKPTPSYEDYLHEELTDDAFAAAYLSECLQESPEVFLRAVKHVIQARQVPIAALANQIGVNRESLYKSLSGLRRPQYATLLKLVSALGFRMQVTPSGFSGRPPRGTKRHQAS